MISDLERIILLSGFSLVDDLTTGIACSTYGTEVEQTSWRKKLMNRFGVWKSIPLQSLIGQVGYYTPVVLTYLVESNFKPNTQPELYRWVWLGVTCAPVYCAVTNTLQLTVEGIKNLVDKQKVTKTTTT